MRRCGRSPGLLGAWVLRLVTALVLLFLIAPALVVIPMSFAGDAMVRFPPRQLSVAAYERFFGRREWLESTFLSFEVGLIVALLAVAIGTLAAFGIAGSGQRLRRIMTLVVLLPVIVPTIVLAIAVYWLLAGWGLIGTAAGFVVAHLVLALPYVVVTVGAALQGLDRTLPRAAASLGASPRKVAAWVVLPLLAPALLTAGLFAFLTSFDEVVIATFISGPHAVTLPKRMWDGILYRADPAIAAISTMLIVLTVLVLIAVTAARRSRAADSERRTTP